MIFFFFVNLYVLMKMENEPCPNTDTKICWLINSEVLKNGCFFGCFSNKSIKCVCYES